MLDAAYWPLRIAEVAADLERSRQSKLATAHLDRDSLKKYILWLKLKSRDPGYDVVPDVPIYAGGP